MICPKCGRRTYKDETVCPKCGAQMPRRRVQPTKPAATVEEVQRYTAPQQPAAPVQNMYVPPVIPPVPQAPAAEPKKSAPIPQVTDPDDALERTLTFKEARNAPKLDSSAVREYEMLHRQLSAQSRQDDGTKVKLDRLPEGYIYQKMSIAEADKFKKSQRMPKLTVGILAVVLSAMALLIILLVFLGKGSGGKDALVGKWTGDIDGSAIGYSDKTETVWRFDDDGELTITVEAMSNMVLDGSYTESTGNGGEQHVDLSVNAPGGRLMLSADYTIESSDGVEILTLDPDSTSSIRTVIELRRDK